MELRHLRFFVAIVEEGSFTTAAEKRLHTAQPSLSRQIRDLEYEVGTPLLLRNARGVEPTAAGRAFLEHARLALAQVEAGVVAARRAAAPTKPTFALGFLTGHEIDWLPEVMRILNEELPSIEVTISSQPSPDLGEALTWGKLDLAFMRVEPKFSELSFQTVAKEPLVVVLPSDHELAAKKQVDVRQLEGQVLIDAGGKATVLHDVIAQYLKSANIPMPESPRGRQPRNGHLAGGVDAWRGAAAPLRGELPALVGRQPSPGRQGADDRPGGGVPLGQPISSPGEVPVEARGTHRARREPALTGHAPPTAPLSPP